MERKDLTMLKEIYKRTNGKPVGVPVSDETLAESLVKSGHLEYSPAAWMYPGNPATYSVTPTGRAQWS